MYSGYNVSVSTEYWVSRKDLSEEVTFKTLRGKKRDNILRGFFVLFCFVFLRKKAPNEEKSYSCLIFFFFFYGLFEKLTIHFSCLNFSKWNFILLKIPIQESSRCGSVGKESN